MNRRSFLRKSAVLGASVSMPYLALARSKNDCTKLTILHTNDVHSHIDPIDNLVGFDHPVGGAEARAALIKSVRAKEEHVLLFDAGDIFQGTPYFNVFKGDLDIAVMNEMEYDAITIGNHDFDAGIDMLSKHVNKAEFSFLNANYVFNHQGLKKTVQPYKIFEKGRLKIGVFGLGIELDGLVPQSFYKNTLYNDPIETALKMEDSLKHDEKCDYIVCLSHLGFEYSSDKVSDKMLARHTKFIDLIIGGHTHTFLKYPVTEMNQVGRKVLINQVGWAGIVLGRLEIFFSKKMKKNWASDNTVIGVKKSIQL